MIDYGTGQYATGNGPALLLSHPIESSQVRGRTTGSPLAQESVCGGPGS